MERAELRPGPRLNVVTVPSSNGFAETLSRRCDRRSRPERVRAIRPRSCSPRGGHGSGPGGSGRVRQSAGRRAVDEERPADRENCRSASSSGRPTRRRSSATTIRGSWPMAMTSARAWRRWTRWLICVRTSHGQLPRRTSRARALVDEPPVIAGALSRASEGRGRHARDARGMCKASLERPIARHPARLTGYSASPIPVTPADDRLARRAATGLKAGARSQRGDALAPRRRPARSKRRPSDSAASKDESRTRWSASRPQRTGWCSGA